MVRALEKYDTATCDQDQICGKICQNIELIIDLIATEEASRIRVSAEQTFNLVMLYETFDNHIDKALTISLCKKGLSVKHRHQFAWFFAGDTESSFLYPYAFLTLAQDHSVEAALEILTSFKNDNAIVEIEKLSLQYFRTVVPPIETVIDCSVATGFEKVCFFTISRSWVVENLKKIDKLAAEFIRRACHDPEKDRLLIDGLIEKCPISEWKDKIQKAFEKEMAKAAAASSNDTSRYRFSYCSAEEGKKNQSQTPR